MQKFLRTLLLLALFAVPLATQAQSYEALNEDFSAAAPEGWVGANTAFAANTATSGSIAWQHASQSINGLPAGHYYADLWLQGRYMWAVTPALDLSLLESAQLAFDLALTVQDGTGAPATVDSGKTVMVLARIGNGSWTKLASWSAADGDSAVASIGGSYTTRLYDLSAFVGKSNVRFAFYAANTTRNGDAVSVHLDNVSVNGVIACQPVTGLVATARTAESITVSWADDVNGAAQFYRVRLLNADGDQVGNSADILASAAFIYTFTGLEASTDYTVEVVTHNSLSIFSDPATLSVRTDCAAKTLPFAEDFESVAVNAAPECWAYTGTGVYVQQNSGSYSIYAHDGTRALRVGPLTGSYTDGYAEIVQMVTLPAMNEPISTMMLSFWLRCGSTYSSSAYGKITVGYLTDPADTSTFVATNAPVFSSSTYTQHYFTFAGAPEGARISIRASKGNYNSSSAYVYIDDVDLSAPCLPVMNLAVSDVTDNSITVSWNPFEGAYKYIAQAVKGTDTITVDVDGTASSATFENLATASNYTISVWHLCAEGDTSIAVSIAASTPCQTLTLPLSFNFDDLTELPACWEATVTAGAPSQPWVIGTGTTGGSYTSAHGGSGKNLAFLSGGRGRNADLVTPVINLEGLVPVLTFWHMQPSWGSDQDVLTIYYRTAEDAEWQQLASYTSSITAWTEEQINLPNPTATYQLKFEAVGDYGYGIAIDDLTIVSPTCFPVELTVGEITGTSISVSWEAQASEPLKYIGKAVSGATVVEAEVAGDATALTFEGLSASSSYNISVYTVCAEGDTSSAAVATASTPCATVDLPFSVDFSTMSALPACWTFDNGIAGSSDYIAINSYSSMSKGLRFASYNTYSCIQYAVTPELNAPSPSTVTVVYATYGSGDKLFFGYSTTDANYDSFTWSDAKTTNRNDATYTVDLPAGVKYLAVKYDGNYSYYAIVKSMTLVSPTCFSVTDLTATVANYHNATISWTDTKNEGATYNVLVVSSADDTLANLTDYESTSLTIDTLQAFTAYTVTVGVNCADDSEVDPVSATFSTPVMCPTPTNFTVTPTRVAATLTWDNPYVDRFLVVVSATALDAEALAALNEESANVTVVEGEQSYLATGLERGTEYHFYLRAVCEGATWVSATATTGELAYCEDIANGTAGSTTRPVPHHLNYKYSLSETILTPEQVGVTGELQGMSYFRTTSNDYTRGIKVWLQPTSKDAFAGTTDWETLNPATATLVYDGAFVSTMGEMYIPFNAPYNYDGTSNLMVIFLDTTGDYEATRNYQSVNTTPYQSIVYYDDNTMPDPSNPPTAKNRYQNIPYMTFRHCGVLDACPVVENVTAVASVDGSAVISWDRPDADYLSGYKLFVSPTAMTTFDTAAAINVDADATSYTATGLTVGEQYYVYIAAYSVRDAALSQWSDEVSFRVPEACSFPENIVAAVTARGTVTLTWQNGDINGEQADNYSLIVARAAMTRDELNAATPDAVAIDTTTLVIDTLAPETDYIFYLRNVCDEETRSSWVASNTVTTPAAMPAVLTTVESFNHSSAIVTWVSDVANYADETAWQVAFRQASSSDELSWTVVTEQRYVFWPLESNTEYNLYVRPYNVETGAFGAAAVETVTTNPFGDETSEPCATVAAGNNANNDVIVMQGGSPTMHSNAQIIYPAAQLSQFVGKQIEKISFRKLNGTTLPSMVVSVAEVEQAAFASAAVVSTTLTQVFDGTPTLEENIITIEFAEPYTYNGGNLLVDIDNALNPSNADITLAGETETGVMHTVRRVHRNGTAMGDASSSNVLPEITICTAAEAQPCATVSEGNNANNDVIVMQGGSPTMHSNAQIIYPAAQLSQFVGKQIEKISFRKLNGTTLPSMVVSVAEVEQAAFASAAVVSTTLTQVFEGTPTLEENIITIEFAEPYTYNGGNLLVDIDNALNPSNADITLAGETETGVMHTVRRVHRNGTAMGDASSSNVLPEITICTAVEPAEACATVSEGNNANNDVIVMQGGSPTMHSNAQIIYPAAQLSQFVGKQIEKISFRKLNGTTLPSMVVSVAEVEQAAFASAAVVSTTLTQVFDGTPTLEENIITIEFAEPYTYNGGNLLVDIDNALNPSNADITLAGETEAGVMHTVRRVHRNGTAMGDASSSNVLPEITICAAGGSTEVCLPVSNLTVENVTPFTASLSWVPGIREPEWEYAYGPAGQEVEQMSVLSVASFNLTIEGLTPETDYVFYVRPACSAGNYGEWKSINFTTPYSCAVPASVTVVSRTSDSVVLAIAVAEGEPDVDAFNVKIWSNTTDERIVTGGDTIVIGDLNGSTTYKVAAQSNCGDVNGLSRWTAEVSFTTICDGTTPLPFTENFSASSINASCWGVVVNDSAMGQYGSLPAPGVRNDHMSMATSDYGFNGGQYYNRYFYSPSFEADDTMLVSFTYKTNTSYVADMYVGFCTTTGTDSADFEWTLLPQAGSATTYKAFVPATVKRMAVAIFDEDGNGYYFDNDYYIDNVSIKVADRYTIAASTADATKGSVVLTVDGDTVNGQTTVFEGTQVRFEAVPVLGYQFVNWTVGDAVISTNAVLSFTPNKDTALVANFTLPNYYVMARIPSAQMAYGTAAVTKVGDTDTNTNRVNDIQGLTLVTLTAEDTVLSDNMVFRGWSKVQNNNTDIVSYDAVYTFPLVENTTLFAQFVTDSFNVALTYDTAMGTVNAAALSSTGKVVMNSRLQMTATEKWGYEFLGWYTSSESTEAISMNASIDTLIDGDKAFFAKFGKIPFYLRVSSNDTTVGTVSASATEGLYETPIVLTATPKAGAHHHFDHWSDGTTENPYNFILTQDTMMKAFFAIDTHKVELLGGADEFGTVAINGEETSVKYFDYGTENIAISATPNTGVTFTGWSDGVTDAERTLETLTGDVVLTANFDSTVYNVTVAYSTNEGVVKTADETTVENNTVYEKYYGDTVVLVAEASTGFNFSYWTDDADNTYTSDTLTYVVADRQGQTLRPVFGEAGKVTVYVRSSNTVAGSAIGNGTNGGVEFTTADTARFDVDGSFTVAATAADHYHFVNWTNANGDTLGTEPTLTYAVMEDYANAGDVVTFIANFAIDVHYLKVAVNDETQGSVTIDGVATDSVSVDYGTNVVLAATAAANHHFVSWNDGNTNADTTVAVTADMVLTAEFAIDVYTYTYTTNIEGAGTVTPSNYVELNEEEGYATFAFGSTATFEATANEGYVFTGWNAAGFTEATASLPVYSDFDLVANFDTIVYNVTTNVNAEQGTIEGPATVKHFLSGIYTAEANYGYFFVNWVDANGTVLGTEPTLTLGNLTSDTAIYAVFDSLEYTITVVSSNVEHGTVSGGATVKYLKTVTLTATPAEGYELVNWTNAAGTVLGTDVELTVTVERDSTITANFGLMNHTVTATVNATEMGSVEGAGTTEHFATATLEATANYGYEFVNWTDLNGNVLGTETTLEVTVLSDTTVKANFQKRTFTATVATNNANMGIATVSGVATYLDTVTYTAQANAHYRFVNWTDAAGTAVGTETTLKVRVTSDTALTANFEAIMRHVTVSVNPANTGSVNVTDTNIADGQSLNLVATPADGYQFESWSNDANAGASQTIVVEGDMTIVANFSRVTYNITLVVTNNAMGTVNGGGVKASGDTITVSATAAQGYRFVSWTEDNVVVSTDADYTFVVTSARTLVANFIAVYTLTLDVNDATMGSVSPVGIATYDDNDEVVVMATANPGYHFVAWVNANNTNDTVSRSARYVFNIHANTSLIAVFAKDPEGIDDVDMENVKIYSVDSKIIVRGAENRSVYVFDVNGRVVNSESNASETIEFRMANTGVYLVKVGNAPAKRVLVVR